MNDQSGVEDRARSGDPVALCQAMVSVPSVNPVLEAGGDGEGAMADRCKKWLDEWGYEVEVDEVEAGRFNVVARSGSHPVDADPVEGRRLILNGHLDTVGVEGMAGDPFTGEIRDGMVWGRGACDMKGGLAIILATAAALSPRRGNGSKPYPGELVVALTADEEHASVGMQRFVEERWRAHGAVVCEPTGLTVMPAHKGFLWIDGIFRGRAAHGSRPEQGIDAIVHAGQFLAALMDLEADLTLGEPHPLLAFPSFHAGTIEGGTAPSVYPSECRLVLERRTLPGEGAEDAFRPFADVLDDLGNTVEDLDATLEPGLFRPGTEVPLEDPLVRTLLAAMDGEGVPMTVEGMTAWVDAAFLNEAGIPAVCFGPGSIAQAHSAQEWVPVEELELGARVLTRFAKEFLAG